MRFHLLMPRARTGDGDSPRSVRGHADETDSRESARDRAARREPPPRRRGHRDARSHVGRRAYAGFARGYQQRWVNALAQHIHVGATRSDTSAVDAINREAFEEALTIIKLAWDARDVPLRGEVSMSTVRYWARVGSIPVLLSGDLEFCRGLFTEYREEAARHGRALRAGNRSRSEDSSP